MDQMGQLDCCPDLVLQDILSRFQSPSQLVALSLTCRRMRDLVAPLIRLKEKVPSLSVAIIEEEGAWLSIPAHPGVEFGDILNRRDLSFCVHEATMEVGVDYMIGVDYQKNLPEPEELKLLETVVDDLSVLEWGDSGPLLKELRLADVEARAAIFLLMLSNLEKLTLCFKSNRHNDEWINWVVRKVVSTNMSRFPKVPYGFLSLREARFSHWDSEVGIRLDRLAPFFQLPALEKVFGFMISHDGEFDWDGELGVSPLTEVHFSHSYVSAEALEKLLRIPKALIKFSYEYGGIIINDEAEFDYDKILGVVTRTQPSVQLSDIEIYIGERAR